MSTLTPLKPSPRRPRVIAVLIGVAIFGLTATGCGEDRSNLLPGDTVREITANLDRVETLADEGECFDALQAAEEVRKQVEALGPKVDRKLRRALLDGVTRLQLTVQDSCETAPSTEPPVTEPPPETETTPTGPTGTTEPEESEEKTPKEGTTGKQKPDGGIGTDQDGNDRGPQGGSGGGSPGGGGNPGGGNPGGNPTPPPSTGPGPGGVGPSSGD